MVLETTVVARQRFLHSYLYLLCITGLRCPHRNYYQVGDVTDTWAHGPWPVSKIELKNGSRPVPSANLSL
jgi:hypothetical protein